VGTVATSETHQAIETVFRIERVGLIALLTAAKGGFLFRTGRLAEARVQLERAAGLNRNEREKAFFTRASCR
jgi:predicted RNA polymerase sigma factor